MFSKIVLCCSGIALFFGLGLHNVVEARTFDSKKDFVMLVRHGSVKYEDNLAISEFAAVALRHSLDPVKTCRNVTIHYLETKNQEDRFKQTASIIQAELTKSKCGSTTLSTSPVNIVNPSAPTSTETASLASWINGAQSEAKKSGSTVWVLSGEVLLAVRDSLMPLPTDLVVDNTQLKPSCPIYLKYWVRQKDSDMPWQSFPIVYEDYCTSGSYGCPICVGGKTNYSQADYDCSTKRTGCPIIVTATGLPNGAACERDAECDNNVCGSVLTEAATPGRYTICCPSGDSVFALFGGHNFCTGMPKMTKCWVDSQCASGNCRGNFGGIGKGYCD